MNLKKLFSVVTVAALLISAVAIIAAAADLPISIGTPENVAVTQSGSTLTVTYAVGASDKTMLQMASNPSILSMFGVETLEVSAQIDYKVMGMTDWLAEDSLLTGPCNLTDTLSVSVSNPALALVDWNTTTLMVRVRWAGTVKMKGADASFMNGDWSDVAYFGKTTTIVPEPTATGTDITEPTATGTDITEPTATSADPVFLGDANEDGAVNMKDVLVLRKYLAGIAVTYNAKNADVNEDGVVNMKDVLILRKYLAGIISLPDASGLLAVTNDTAPAPSNAPSSTTITIPHSTSAPSDSDSSVNRDTGVLPVDILES